MTELSKEFNPKARRFKDAKACLDAYNAIRKDSADRRKSVARVQGQLNGGLPFSPAELRKAGLPSKVNINFRDAASQAERVALSYWRLAHDTPRLIDLTVRSKSPDAGTWANTFISNFNRFILEDWGSDYDLNYNLMAANHVAFGVGPVMWANEKSPRWVAINYADFEPLKGTRASSKSMECVMVRQPDVQPVELWERFNSPDGRKTAEDIGWNYNAVLRLITQAYKNDFVTEPAPDDYQKMEENLRENLFGVTATCSALALVHCFTKEYDGKITHTIFSEAKLPAHSGSEFEYLFDNHEIAARPTSMEEVLACIYFEVGTGRHHSVKGFGHKNYHIAKVVNRLRCKLVEQTDFASGLNFINKSGGAIKDQLIQTGGVNIFPTSLEQVRIEPDLTSQAELIASLENLSNVNNSRYTDTSQAVAKTNTATQANILGALQSQVDVGNASFYLRQIAERLYKVQFKRLRARNTDDPDAIEFKKRCLAEGMPEEVFYDLDVTVTSGSSPGTVSMAAKGQAYDRLMSWSGLPEVNRRYALEGYVSQTLGANEVARALTPQQEQYGDAASSRAAILEDAAMNNGMAIPVDSTDRHDVHLQVHLSDAQRFVEAYEAGKVQLTQHTYFPFENVMTHAAEHFKYLQQDEFRKGVYQQLFPAFSKLTNALAKIKNDVMQALEAQQNEAQQTQQADEARLAHNMALAQAVGARDVDPETLRTAPGNMARQSQAQQGMSGGNNGGADI